MRQLVVPDVSLAFWRSVRSRVSAIVEEIGPTVILTTSPPHSIHDVGLWLSTRYDLPWVADFRDPYRIDCRYAQRSLACILGAKHAEYERKIYDGATLITHAIPLHARWARQIYPHARSRIKTLPNGCPPNHQAVREGTAAPEFPVRICSAGTLGVQQALLIGEALSRLAQQGIDLHLSLVGARTVAHTEVVRLLGGRAVVLEVLDHVDALREIASAHILVSGLSSERSRSMGLSSKLYEYLAAGRPIIAINPTLPDRQLLHGLAGTAILSDPTCAQLEAAFRWALSDLARVPATQIEWARRTFDRQAQVRELAGWLDQLVPSSSHG